MKKILLLFIVIFINMPYMLFAEDSAFRSGNTPVLSGYYDFGSSSTPDYSPAMPEYFEKQKPQKEHITYKNGVMFDCWFYELLSFNVKYEYCPEILKAFGKHWYIITPVSFGFGYLSYIQEKYDGMYYGKNVSAFDLNISGGLGIRWYTGRNRAIDLIYSPIFFGNFFIRRSLYSAKNEIASAYLFGLCEVWRYRISNFTISASFYINIADDTGMSDFSMEAGISVGYLF